VEKNIAMSWSCIKGILFCSSFLFCYLNGAGQILSGSVYDAENKEKLPYASVALLNPSDSSVLQGMITDENGDFSFTFPEQTVMLEANYISYKVFYQAIRPDQVKGLSPLSIFLE